MWTCTVDFQHEIEICIQLKWCGTSVYVVVSISTSNLKYTH